MSGTLPDDGLLLVDKPTGWTSFDVVAWLRGRIRVRRTGHTGTLDPFAEGLLVVCVGRAAAAVRFLDLHDKVYRVTVRFGTTTDSGDRTGRPVGGRMPDPEEARYWLADGAAPLRALAARLEGERWQVPPMHSAVKVNGEPLYKAAREGRSVERKPRPIRVDRAELLSASLRDGVLEADLRLACSKGTYIRGLCDTLGEWTGLGAHAAQLVRESCGPFRLEDALTPDEILARMEREDWRSLLLPLASAFRDYPVLSVDPVLARRLLDGHRVALVTGTEGLRIQGAGQVLAGPGDGSAIPGDRASGPWAAWLGDRFLGIVSGRPDGDGNLVLHAERMWTSGADLQGG